MYKVTIGRNDTNIAADVVSDPMPFYAAQEVYARMVMVDVNDLHGSEGMSWTGNIRMGVAPNTRGLLVTISPVED